MDEDKPENDRPANGAATLGERGERVAKVMARAGLCSRRAAEAWIGQGRVAINGRIISSPAINVGPQDKVSVDGKPLAQRQRTRLFLFHKPRGLVTTNKDPQGRKTIFEYLAARHPAAPRLVSVGRLDITTEGLLLLTNDGGLARLLELPATGWLRRYRVRAHGTIDQASLDRLAHGLRLDGMDYAGIEAKLDRVQGANCWLIVGLREGKNREIKRVLEHLGLAVNRLIRVSFGPFQLGDLDAGDLEEVRARVLREQLGPALLREARVDLDAPLDRPIPGAAKPERELRRARVPRPRPALERAEKDKRKERPRPGPRKHVSALRAAAASSEPGKRRRVARTETTDRKGRVIGVERRIAANAAPAPGGGNRRRPGKGRKARPPVRPRTR